MKRSAGLLGRALACGLLLGSGAPRPAQAAKAAKAPAAPPTVEHEPVTQVLPGKPVDLQVRIRSIPGTTVLSANLFYRHVGTIVYVRAKLAAVPETAGVFTGTIPADFVSGDFEYYVSAYDSAGNGPGSAGSAARPLRVHLSTAVAAVEPPPKDSPKELPKDPTTPKDPPREPPKEPPRDVPPHVDLRPPLPPDVVMQPGPVDRTGATLTIGGGALLTLGGAVVFGIGTQQLHQTDSTGRPRTTSAVATLGVGAGLAAAGLVVMRVGQSLWESP